MIARVKFHQEALPGGAAVFKCSLGMFYTRSVFIPSQFCHLLPWRIWSEATLLKVERRYGVGSLWSLNRATSRVIGMVRAEPVDLGHCLFESVSGVWVARRFAIPFEDAPPRIYTVVTTEGKISIQIGKGHGLWSME